MTAFRSCNLDNLDKFLIKKYGITLYNNVPITIPMPRNRKEDSLIAYRGHEQRKKTPLHDVIQIALAIADEKMLIELVTNCRPPIITLYKKETYGEHSKELLVESLWIDYISSRIEVPVKGRESADGLISLRVVGLIDKEVFNHHSPAYVTTRYPEEKIDILIEIKTEIQSFGETLRQINYYKEQLNLSRKRRNEPQIKKAILVCDTVSEMEAQGFISQGISVYPATRLALPTQANCSICVANCLLRGETNSPVIVCSSFDTWEKL
jgi:hypothetical protein